MLKDLIWTDIEEKKKLGKRLDKTVLAYSAWMFFGGMLLSIVLFIWVHFSKDE